MKILFYSVFLVSLISCKSETKPFLDFDHIDYYSLSISDIEEARIRFKKIKSQEDENFLSILDGNVSKNLTKDSIITIIESTNYFTLHKVPDSLNSSFSELFSPFLNSGAFFFSNSSLCEPLYRDILVFKKNEEIVGAAFVCLWCYKVFYYSQNGFELVIVNFEELEKLMNRLLLKNS